MASEVDFISASVALRPPRIAILVADDEHWRDWVMTALTIASGYWGGGSWILVPFDIRSSRPASEFAEIVRAYDPDHVVSIDLHWQLFEEWYPGHIRINGVADDVERRRMIANHHQHTTVRESDEARDEVVSWCSPMRSVRFRDDPARQREQLTRLRARDLNAHFNRGLAPSPPPADPLQARLAASSGWRSDFGLMAAMRVGVAQSESATGARPEPTADDLGWLIRSVDDAPASLIWNSTTIETKASAGLENWFLADQRLLQVSNGYIEDRAAVVIGDTAIDFALAVAYDRLVGSGIWLPRALIDDGEAFRDQVQRATWMLATDLEGGGAHMSVSSSSEPTLYLNKVAPRIVDSPLPPGLQSVRDRREETVRVGPPIIDGGYLEYVVDEHIGASKSIPVRTNENGSSEAISGLETPTPSELLYPLNSGWVPYWYVDIAWFGDKMPRGRDIPAHALVADEGPLPSVSLRASRESVTIDPHSMGLVMAGSFLPGRIGRPRLRGLSMMAWVEAMAGPEGLGVRLSRPGRQAELIRRRLGSRAALLDLMTPENVGMLRAFIPREKGPTSDERKADPETVVLDDLDPFLTFEAMRTLFGGDADATTSLVDRLTVSRLLRRGLILDCTECGRPSFVDADRVAQVYECSRCAAMNALVSARWKEKRSEPRWFYNLYAAFRELLGANGDTVLLGAAALRGSSRSYIDSPELEFYELQTGRTVAEIDVIASVNREVVLVEGKSNGKFNGKANREDHAEKMLQVAKALRANRIVFATTMEAWSSTDVKHFEREGAKVAPFPVKIEVLARLGA
ncbi:MAG: hypothetical protein J0I43_11630 [Microbacterium sp.]|uniref:hypothetical protein n=1 Tax=Microbacterium sp. TaxID=51671 RepID=UPI001AC0B179|nr:hypothetical protein [Microbacterium sp.]MBN9178001.1 hypothetical protein [Microbacterium sp.]